MEQKYSKALIKSNIVLGVHSLLKGILVLLLFIIIKYCFRSTFSFKRHISLITIYNIVFNNMDKRKIFKLHKNKCIYSTNNIPYFNCGHSNH